MTKPVFSVDTMLLRAVEQMLNFKLQTVPLLDSQLANIAGKLIGLEVAPMNLQLFFAIQSDGIEVFATPPRLPDVWIRGTVVNLVKAGASSLQSGIHLDISGDVEVGQTFQRLLRRSGFDWEELLSLCIGDIAAHWVGQGVRQASVGFGRMLDTMSVSAGEYLIEEIDVLVYDREVRHFIERVDILRNDIERLEVRLKKLIAEQV